MAGLSPGLARAVALGSLVVGLGCEEVGRVGVDRETHLAAPDVSGTGSAPGCLSDSECAKRFDPIAEPCMVAVCVQLSSGAGECMKSARPPGLACGAAIDMGSCTGNVCDGKGVCLAGPVPDGVPCGAVTACGAKLCTDGACKDWPGPNCDDANPCTTDGCDPFSGCTHANNDLACDDGNACTEGDVCSGGACAGKNVCSCAVKSDCLAEMKDECGNQFACIDKKCVMQPGTALDCSKIPVLPCQVALCDPSTGSCTVDPAPNDAPCEDGNPCTGGDYCSGGLCSKGNQKLCTEACTNGQDDDLDGKTDCLDEECDGKACDDGDPGTSTEKCVTGTCKVPA